MGQRPLRVLDVGWIGAEMAKGFAASEAKALVGRAKELLSEMDSMNALFLGFDRALREAVNDARMQKRDQLLSRIGVRRTKEGGYEVVDPSKPFKRGIASLVDAVHVGDYSAPVYRVGWAATTVADCMMRAFMGSRLRVEDIEDGSPWGNEIVTAAYRSANAVAYAHEFEMINRAIHDSIAVCIDDLEVRANALKWWMLSQENKRAAEQSYEKLNEVMNGFLVERFHRLEGDVRSIVYVTDDDARDWFASNTDRASAIIESAASGSLGDDDWPITSEQAQDSLKRARDLAGRLERFESSSRIDDRVRDAVKGALSKNHAELLEETPIEELGKLKKGMRTKALREAGFQSVADVYAATLSEIESVRGISLSGAADIKRAASTLASESKKALKLRLNADDRSPSSTGVICAVYARKRWMSLADDRTRLQGLLISRIGDAAPGLEFAADRFTWLFAGEDEKGRALASYRSLNSFLCDSECRKAWEVTRSLAEFESGEISADEAWSDFCSDPVSFSAALEELVPNVLGGDDGFFGLPEELAREIQDECFFPDGLLCTLRRYQEWGVKYILHQGKSLLGDEMGLGKTIQAIAAMVSLRNVGESHFVVICPASVLENWYREIRRHSRLRASKVHGNDRAMVWEDWLKAGGVAVTTYETTAKLDLPQGFKYGLAVVDEAHYIKNPEAARTRNTLRLLEGANRTVLMTGTALENRIEEMLTLIGYLRPDVAKRAEPLAFMAKAQEFRDEIAQVYYRRKRSDVLAELPELIESEEWCTLGAVEEEVYERSVLSKSFMEARRVSWNVPDLKYSSKARRLKEIMADAQDDGRKVLVFTFFLDTAAAVAEVCGEACVGVINGSINPTKRQEVVEQFDDAAAGSVLVAQIQSGGTGMNIQSASVVVICEPQYKPSIENQAISRAYRMGQTRNVLVYRLLCEETVDERMTDLLKEKQKIFDTFADKSFAAAAAEGVSIDEKGMGKIIEEEIERIKAKNPDLVAEVERARADV